jgi:hypothetical protein
MVQCKKAKISLKEADRFGRENNLDNAFGRTAVAFEQILNDYEKTKKSCFLNPFHFGQSSISSKRQIFGRIVGSSSLQQQIDQALNGVVKMLMGEITSVQSALKLISLGIDYRRYVKFKMFVPEVGRQGSERISCYWDSKKMKGTLEDLRFCIDFVIETALKLQQFDFVVEADKARHGSLRILFESRSSEGGRE